MIFHKWKTLHTQVLIVDPHCHYLMILGYYVPLWFVESQLHMTLSWQSHRFARLSILFTIFRLAPHRKERIVLSCKSKQLHCWPHLIVGTDIAGLFVAEWVFLLAQAVWVSEGPHPLWHSTKSQPLMMSVAQLISACSLIFCDSSINRYYSGRRVWHYSRNLPIMDTQKRPARSRPSLPPRMCIFRCTVHHTRSPCSGCHVHHNWRHVDRHMQRAWGLCLLLAGLTLLLNVFN